MIARFRSKLTYANVTATIAVFLALGGGAYAAISGIPDSSGVFHACVNNGTGAVRVVKPGVPCKPRKTQHGRVVFAGEFATAWNQRGPTGPRGDNGANGLNGTNGTNGTNGINGLDGAAIAARARMTGPDVTPPDFPANSVDVPLSGNTWTQAANETDLVIGQITYDSPSPADCDGNTGHGLILYLAANGEIFAQHFMDGTFVAGISRTIPAEVGSGVGHGTANKLPILFEPGTDTPQTLTASIQQNCGGATHYKVKSLKLDVVRLR